METVVIEQVKHEIPEFNFEDILSSQNILHGEMITSEDFTEHFPLNENNIKKRKKKKKPYKSINDYTSYPCRECKKKFSDRSLLKQHMKLHSTEYPYKCKDCHLSFKIKKYLTKHTLRVHEKKNKYKCDFCKKSFFTQYALTKHIMIHTGEKPFECDICGKCFNRGSLLKIHSFTHTGEKPYKCGFCDYACRDPSTLKRHENRHMGLMQKYQCKICKYNCKAKWILKQHVAEKHLDLDVKNYECGHCDAKFKFKQVLRDHIRTVHQKSKPYQCDICKSFISRRSNLITHVRNHFSDKVFKCDFDGCDKGFKTKGDMDKHNIIHFPKKHKPCPDCGKRFSRPYRMESHRKAVHKKRWKNTPCGYCGAHFYSQSYLDKHIKFKHRDDDREKYICDYCGQSHFKKTGLIIHMRHLHLKKMKYECDVCSDNFKNLTLVKIHKWEEHGIQNKWQSKNEEDPPVDDADIKEEIIEVEETDLEEVLRRMEQCDAENAAGAHGTPYSDGVLTEDIARSIITNNRNNLQRVPEEIFDQYYIEHVIGHESIGENVTKENSITQNNYQQELAKECMEEILTRVRKQIVQNTLIRLRQKMRNETIVRMEEDGVTKKNINIKMQETNENDRVREKILAINEEDESTKPNINENNQETKPKTVVKKSQNDRVRKKMIKSPLEKARQITINRPRRISSVVNYMDFFKEHDSTMDVNTTVICPTEKLERKSNLKNSSKTKKIKSLRRTNKMATKDKMPGSHDNRQKNGIRIKFNTFQCYACFKLFETKEKLIEHCREHFKLENKQRITNCPLCDFRAIHGLWKHMKLNHGIKLNNASSELTLVTDRVTNEKKFVVKVKEKRDCQSNRDNSMQNHINVTEIEITPTVQHINKQLAAEIDKRNRKRKNETILKRKLVRKGKEWFIETKQIDVDRKEIENIVDINEEDSKEKEDLSIDPYLDKMFELAKKAKKERRTILFPCNMCSKICTALCGLKLHRRIHNTKAKPFKPKVWKHKLEHEINTPNVKSTNIVENTENRKAKPKSIPKKKYNCDDNLKEFFKNNITGSDIDFDQFLKEYRKINKIHEADLVDLENDKEFGINKNYLNNKTPRNKAIINKNYKYKIVGMLSKNEYKNRVAIMKELRARNNVASNTDK